MKWSTRSSTATQRPARSGRPSPRVPWPRSPPPWPLRDRWWSIRLHGHAAGPSKWWSPRSASRDRTSRCCRNGSDCPDRSPSRGRRSAACSGSSREPASTTTPTSPTSPWPRTKQVWTSPSSSAPSRGRECRSRRSNGSSTPGSPLDRTPRSASVSTSHRSGASWPDRSRCPGSDGPGSSPRPSCTRRLLDGGAEAGLTLDNGLVTVIIDPDDGTFSLNGRSRVRAAGRRR